MSMPRVVLPAVVFASLCACSVSCLAAGQGAGRVEQQRPNFLLIIADDWSWPHAGAYGYPVVRTPNFDRVAGKGALFTNAYVASPSCTPSRAAILTGQWHWRLKESANLWSTLRKEFDTYPDLLERASYFVGYTGKGWGPGRIEPGGRRRNPAGKWYKSFRQFLQARPAGQPFCFWFGSFDPHRPYKAGSGEGAGIDPEHLRVPACLPDVPEVRSDLADYLFEVQRFDQDVGRLLVELERREELSRTIVVVTADNGLPFPRCKANLYDTGTRVPLAIMWPGRFPAGRTVHDLVSLTDLAPTFLELAGLKPTGQMTGKSLLRILQSERCGRVDPARDRVLTGKERHVPCQEWPDSGGTPMRAIRTYKYLYIRNFRPDRWPAGTPHYDRAFLPGSWYGDIDNGPTKLFMFQQRNDPRFRRLFELAFEKRPAEELYDLERDPDQLKNVAGEARYAAVKRVLAEQFMSELRRSGDPGALGAGEQFDSYPYYGGTPRWPGIKPSKNK